MWATRGFGQKNDDSFNEIAAHLPHLLGLRELELLIRKISAGLNGDPSFRTGFFGGFPHVRRLVLLCRWDSKAEPAPLIDMICLFPALEELEIRQGFEVSVSSPLATAVPPWPLRRLELVTTPFKTIRPFFAWLDAFGHLPNVDVVRLPRLKSEHDVLGARQILQQLGGGVLQYFDIAVQWWSTHNSVNACTAFDLSLHPNLKELVIRDLSLRRFDFDRNRILLRLSYCV
ncbi:hypothetical protein B0H14DRAFT_1331927 [Mycena olivaceomarginata]|nr:hypothetical protein B0H14DRAFT_1331927 [Mycena olivaceomarginata]